MGDTRDRMGAAGVAVAGGFFKIALYVCVAVLIIWIGKVTYQFGYCLLYTSPSPRDCS